MIGENSINALLKLGGLTRILICMLPFLFTLFVFKHKRILQIKKESEISRTTLEKVFQTIVALFFLFLGVKAYMVVNQLEVTLSNEIKMSLITKGYATTKKQSEELFPIVEISERHKDGSLSFSLYNKISNGSLYAIVGEKKPYLTGKIYKQDLYEIRYSDSRYVGITKTLQKLKKDNISFYNFEIRLDGTSKGLTTENQYFETSIVDGKVNTEFE